ncbi:hypothetical protein HA402_000002 [Bradysia odoriphaga]|nr:hypothetical protein HA402_000002 [Bradysia odoriphaga]
MLKCKKCEQICESLKEFFDHNRHRHPNIIQIRCPYARCSRLYSNRLSLKSHLQNPALHLNESDPGTSTEPLSEEETEFTSEDVCNNQANNGNSICSESEIILDLKNDMMRHAVSLLSDETISRKKSLEFLKSSFGYYSKAVLRFRGGTDNKNFEDFCEFFSDPSSVQSEYKLIKALTNAAVLRFRGGTDNKNFEDFCEFFSDPSSVQSEYKLIKALTNAGMYIQSKEHILSHDLDLKYVNSVPKLHTDKRVVRYFNATEILDKFLNLPGIMQRIVEYKSSNEFHKDESISNIMQSPLWRKLLSVEKTNDSTLFLPLNLFFDDFEPQNVIGSHSGAYKIGSSYMGLPFLPDDMVSKLEFIFPVSLFFSEDREYFGNENVFKPVIEMLNELYLTGINVNYGKIRKVKFIVTLILGDNLGLNAILGFTQCFVANYYCRFCILRRDVLQTLLFEDLKSLRNYENYCHHVILDKLSEKGISEECVFNNLCKFHVTRNFSVDILHDFLEGVCHYDLCNIIINLINKKYFTLDELNSNIMYHNYGPFTKNKKIDPITVENLEKLHLRTSGAEMKTLVLNL